MTDLRLNLCATTSLALLAAACGGSESGQPSPPPNSAPTLAAPPTIIEVDENETETGYFPNPTDADGDQVALNVGGADGDLFEINVDGQLVLTAAPDFEAPADANADNFYSFTVTASDGEASTSVQGEVQVFDVAELPSGVASLSIITNPSSPTFARAELAEGIRYELRGRRTEDGLPDALDELIVRDLDAIVTDEEVEAESAIITRDSNGDLSNFLFNTGERFRIIYNDQGEVVALEYTSADGSEVERVQVDDTAGEASSASSQAGAGRPVNRRSGDHVTVSYEPRADGRSTTNFPAAGTARATTQSSITSAEIAVDVTECGAGVADAEVRVELSDGEREYLRSATYRGSGRYSANFFLSAPEPVGAEASCNNVGEAVSLFCDVEGAVDGLEKALAACARFPTAKTTGICGFALAALDRYCERLDPFANNEDVRAEACEAALADNDVITGSQLTYEGIVFPAEGGSARTNFRSAPLEGPYPTLALNLDDIGFLPELEVGASPDDPAPGQGYQVFTDVSCRANATRVEFSVSGTDGFSDSATCALPASGEGRCTFGVPGAVAGTEDTVRINAGDASAILRIRF